jgi:hypothetical protein
VPQEGEVVDCLAAGRQVVDADVRVAGHLPAGRDDVHAHEFQPVLFGFGDRHRQQHDGVDLAPGRQPFEEAAPVLGVVHVIEQHVEVGVAQHRLEPFEQRGEEPAGDVRHDDRDPPGGAAGQPGRLGGDHVGQALGHRPDPGPGVGRDVRAVAERA